jgi:hypothetical protein
MWNLRKMTKDCRRLRDALEEAAERHPEAANVKELMDALSAEERKHIEACRDCHEAVQELVATKELFQGVTSFAEEERPWFAARVMAAISAREREIAARLNTWSEFSRFAPRFAWVTAVLLLAGTTWFYEKVVRAPVYELNGSPQESIFEAPQPASQDDTLISMAGDTP